MSDKQNSYGNILKATGLFGGVKVYEMMISIIRSKFVAILLGPDGMGVYGLINSPISLIKSVTGFGLQTSGVREVSKAFGEKDELRKDYIITILRRLVWLTGLLGLLVSFCFSDRLSVWSFGDTNYSLWFKLVSVTLLIDQIVVGQRVLMQGTFHYSFLAKSAVIGNTIGLFVTVPLYYIYGIKGVVPVFILHSVTTFVLSWYFSKKIPTRKVALSLKDYFSGGATMIGLGVAFALTGAVELGKDYLLRIYISNAGNIADVGLFNAGIAIATSYIGVVLSAMGTDYVPRLSAASGDNKQFNEIVNRQLQLLVVIVSPLVAMFILFIKQVVILLYSSKFIPITGMIEWIMFGMFFRAVAFCLSYSVVAKADSKRFFWNEFLSASYSLLLFILGYKFYGFEGMGIAYFLSFVLYSIQMYILCKLRYGFKFEGRTLRIITVQMFIIIVLLALAKFFHYSAYRYIFGIIWTGIICLVSYQQLNQMIKVKDSILAIKKRILHK